MFPHQNDGQLLSVIWRTLYTQLNSANTVEVVKEFMNIVWDNIVRNLRVEGVKKIQNHKLHHSPYSFTSKSVIILITENIIQSQFYRKKLHVFLKKKVKKEQGKLLVSILLLYKSNVNHKN